MKILVIRFSSIGDIVLTTPVVRCLKQQLPDAEIHYLTKPVFAPLLKNNPNVTRIHLLQDDFGDLISQLRGERYDHVIDLHNNLRSLRVKWLLGVKYSTFSKLNIRKWLLTQLKIDLMPDVHIVHRYMDTCAHLGAKYDGKGLDYFYKPGLPENIKLTAPYSVYAMGGTYTTKKLPYDKARELLERDHHNWVLIGGASESEEGKMLSAGLNHVTSHCGDLNFDQSAEVMDGADMILTHDSGMMHIAAALGKPMVSIWGNTVPEFGMSAFYSDDISKPMDHRSEVQGLDCRPCSKLGYDSCPKAHFRCMRDQDIPKILENLSGTR